MVSPPTTSLPEGSCLENFAIGRYFLTKVK